MRQPADHGLRMFHGDFKPTLVVLPPGKNTTPRMERPARLSPSDTNVPGIPDAVPMNTLYQSYGGT